MGFSSSGLSHRLCTSRNRQTPVTTPLDGLQCVLSARHRNKAMLICGNKMPTRCNRWFLLQILLLAQHVSSTIMPSSGAREYYTSGCCLSYLVLWFSSCRYDVELRVVCPVCGSINHFTISARIHLGTCWPRSENMAVCLVMYMYVTCSMCKPPNVAPLCCNFLTCRLGAVPAHHTKCITYPRINFASYFYKATLTQVNLHVKWIGKPCT